jgi:hypothetical protein
VQIVHVNVRELQAAAKFDWIACPPEQPRSCKALMHSMLAQKPESVQICHGQCQWHVLQHTGAGALEEHNAQVRSAGGCPLARLLRHSRHQTPK